VGKNDPGQKKKKKKKKKKKSSLREKKPIFFVKDRCRYGFPSTNGFTVLEKVRVA
jgi:hypothetical protein